MEAIILTLLVIEGLIIAILYWRMNYMVGEVDDIWKAMKQHLENNQRENKTIWSQLAEHDEKLKQYGAGQEQWKGFPSVPATGKPITQEEINDKKER